MGAAATGLFVRLSGVLPMEDKSLVEAKEGHRRRPVLSAGRLTLLGAGIICVVVLVTCVYPPLARSYTTSHGAHLTLAEARQRDIQLDLPPEASDICFYQHLKPDQVVRVDFAITEDAFLTWATRQGWRPEKSDESGGGVKMWPGYDSGFGDTQVHVTDGYFYHTWERGMPNTFSVLHDRRSQRAAYSFHSEPGKED
jgi:hypothetical protein